MKDTEAQEDNGTQLVLHQGRGDNETQVQVIVRVGNLTGNRDTTRTLLK